MNIQALILDLDGTLLDSMPIWHEIDIAFFAENGLTLPEGLSEQVAKMSIPEWADFFVREFVPDMTPQQVIQHIEEMAADYYQHRIPLKPYVWEFLDFWDSRGIPYGIATATYYSSASSALKRLGLLDRMQFLLTGDRCREKSRMYAAAQEQLGTLRQETLIVEDAIHCIRTAVQEGFLVAAVYDASTPADAWEEACRIADLHGKNLQEILQQL